MFRHTFEFFIFEFRSAEGGKRKYGRHKEKMSLNVCSHIMFMIFDFRGQKVEIRSVEVKVWKEHFDKMLKFRFPTFEFGNVEGRS